MNKFRIHVIILFFIIGTLLNTNAQTKNTANPLKVICPDEKTLEVFTTCETSLGSYANEITIIDSVSNSFVIKQSPERGTKLTIGSYEVAITVSDSKGNTSSCIIKTNVITTLKPLIYRIKNQILYIDKNGQIIIPDYIPEAMISDFCDPNPKISQRPSPGILKNFENYRTAVIKAENKYGLSDSISFDLYYSDTIPPQVIVPELPPLYLNDRCQADIPDYGKIVELKDNYSTPVVVRQLPAAGSSANQPGKFEVELEVVDQSSNSTTARFEVEAIDTIAPFLDDIPSQKCYLSKENIAFIPDYLPRANIYENCQNNFIAKQTPPAGPLENYSNYPEVKIIATDASNNADSVVFSISYLDTISPEVRCISQQTLYLNEACSAILPDFTDSIKIKEYISPIIKIIQTPLNGKLLTAGKDTLSIVAIDSSMNSAFCIVPLNIIDTISPKITNKIENHSVANESGSCYHLLKDYSSELQVVNNCEDSLKITQIPLAGSQLKVDTTFKIQLFVSDLSGNQASTSFLLTTYDKDPPIWNGCNTITSCDPKVDYSLPLVSDNCGISKIEQIEGLPPGSVFPIDTTQISYRATDLYGNSSTCSFYIIINEKPNVMLEEFSKDKICIYALPITLPKGSPKGGNYSGKGIIGNLFWPKLAGIGTHSIAYTFSNKEGCSNTASSDINVVKCLGTHNTEENSELIVYPNPVHQELHIIDPSDNIEHLQIFNYTGQQVFSGKANSKEKDIHINNLSPGIYMVDVITDKGKHVFQKIIKK